MRIVWSGLAWSGWSVGAEGCSAEGDEAQEREDGDTLAEIVHFEDLMEALHGSWFLSSDV